MQVIVGMVCLLVRRQITRICRVFEKTRQFRSYAFGLGFIRQLDIVLVMLLNREDNILRRYVINKRLRYAGVSKRGNY